MLNIAGKKNIFLTASALLVGAAIVCIVAFRFHEGIDFSGGTLWQVRVNGAAVSLEDMQSTVANTLHITESTISYDSGSNSFLMRLPEISEQDHQGYVTQLQQKYPGFTELSFSSIGPSVSASLRQNAIIAMILVLVGISLYIAYAFRKVSRPISSWKYGWITLMTLFHDVAIPAGLLAVLGKFGRVEIDTNFVVALLVVMGFSVHDTIVVFDRIRENLFVDRGKTSFKDIINKSVNQTLARSINTSLTLILVLLALFFTGPANLKYFVLTLLVGVATGIYSSIFVASPALLLLSPKQRR